MILPLLLLLLQPCGLVQWLLSDSWIEREPSPDGRYEVVRENRNCFLDGFTKLWITERGEQDRSRWFLIAPEVDGTWFTEWLGPNELMLSDHGAWPENRMPYGIVMWRDT